MGAPKNGWLIMENPIYNCIVMGVTPIAGWFISWKIPSTNRWWLGVPLIISGNHHMKPIWTYDSSEFHGDNSEICIYKTKLGGFYNQVMAICWILCPNRGRWVGTWTWLLEDAGLDSGMVLYQTKKMGISWGCKEICNRLWENRQYGDEP